MATNIFGVLNTGKVGLLSQQFAIEVTGQNIANVQTEGYSRQKIVLAANDPRAFGLGQIGTGVKVSGIERAHDEFLASQITDEKINAGLFDLKKDVFEQMEILFDSTFGGSLNDNFNEFFGSLQDLANNPGGLAERADVLGKAETILEEFKRIGDGLFNEKVNLDQTIIAEVSEINGLLTDIAELNSKIHQNETVEGFNANDLRDRRDRLVNQLAEKMDINVTKEADGQVDITTGNGQPLVLKQQASTLTTTLNGNNNGFRDINLVDPGNVTTNITSTLQGGKIKGLVDMRDTELDSTLDILDRLAAGFIQEVNRVHKEGVGNDGSSGLDFFTTLTPTSVANTNNTGSASVAITNSSPTTVSVDKFQIQFTGSNSFTLNNLTTGLASGTFTFTNGTPVTLVGGLSVTFSGTASSGDQIDFSVSEGASRTASVSSTVKNNLQKIAAGKTLTGDGQNALELSNLQNRLTFNGTSLQSGSGAFTFSDFYNSIVTSVAVNSSSAKLSADQQEGIQLQLNIRRESNSGVSIDEEMVNLIKFQQAFNAAARIITTVEEMLNTLQNNI
jgi:flagellar hook-associated protein 1 FlgK